MLRAKMALLVVTVLAFVGCKSNKIPNNSGILSYKAPTNTKEPGIEPSYLELSEPDICDFDAEYYTNSLSPDDILDYTNIAYTEISLHDCVVAALRHSEVFRNASGSIVNAPASIGTALDPAIAYTDPQFGEEAALSAFDANFVTSAFFENNDRPFNNSFSGDSDGLFKQDLLDFRTEINKLSAGGTQFNARSGVIYDANNQAGNRFPHSYQAILDFGFRHPLLQGSGSLFNRIAGPSQTPGVYNGVLIARTNTEISLTDFQAAVRNLVSDVENAYWDLYYAYRELEAQTDSRDKAFEHLAQLNERQGGKKFDELGQEQVSLEQASAREQVLRFETAIVDSLEGRNIEGTTTLNGSSGGAFRRNVGVRTAERRLRYLMGLPITDGQLLQPSELPVSAPLRFDWQDSVDNAVCKRPEILRQKWLVKQRELELTAARNFLLPRLDLVGNYRYRGLGRSLTGEVTLAEDIAANDNSSAALGDLFGGDFQEFQFGAEYRRPVGFRQGHAAVRTAQLSVQREKARLKEQMEKIVLDLSNSISEVRRSYSAMTIAQQRFAAANRYYEVARTRWENNRIQIDVLLEAQRRILEARLQFINAEAEYAIAVKNVHFEKGTFLDGHGIVFSESISTQQAYSDFTRRNSNKRPIENFVREGIIGHSQGGSIGPLVNGFEFAAPPEQTTALEPLIQNIGDSENFSDSINLGDSSNISDSTE